MITHWGSKQEYLERGKCFCDESSNIDRCKLFKYTQNPYTSKKVELTRLQQLTHCYKEDIMSISSMFYEQLLRVQILKAQKDSQVVSPFCAFGICAHKSCSKNVDEIDPPMAKRRPADCMWPLSLLFWHKSTLVVLGKTYKHYNFLLIKNYLILLYLTWTN